MSQLSRYDFQMIVTSVKKMIEYKKQIIAQNAGNRKILLDEIAEWIRFEDKMQKMWDATERRMNEMENPTNYPNIQ